MRQFATVAIALVFGSLAAYALGRIKFRGRNVTLYVILAMTMFPAIAILGSLFQMMRNFHLYNTIPGLVLTYMTFTLPFTVWVLSNFFKAMPGELEEAALVDGSTPFQAFYKIMLPLAMPGLVTTGLLAFIAAWNEFLFSLTFTNTYAARTVQPAIASFRGNTQYEEPWGSIMAAAVVVTVPLVILVLIFQRKILAGLTAGRGQGVSLHPLSRCSTSMIASCGISGSLRGSARSEPFHCYFLQAPRSLPDPEMRHDRARIGHATSTNLIDWDYHGTILPLGEPGEWDDWTQWTGSVTRYRGQELSLLYRAFEIRADQCPADRRGLIRRPSRLDKIASRIQCCRPHRPGTKHPPRTASTDPIVAIHGSCGIDDRWLMYYTASAAGEPPDRYGVVGLATSDDLIHWMPGPPVAKPGVFGEIEVPQVFPLGERWAMLFCTAKHAEIDGHRASWNGTHYFLADTPIWSVRACSRTAPAGGRHRLELRGPRDSRSLAGQFHHGIPPLRCRMAVLWGP